MSDSAKELKIQVTTAADLSALKQTAEALKGVSDSAGKSSASATLLREAARELGKEFPLAGAAMETAFDPLAGITHLAAIGIGAITGKLKEQAAAVEEWRRSHAALLTHAAGPPESAEKAHATSPEQIAGINTRYDHGKSGAMHEASVADNSSPDGADSGFGEAVNAIVGAQRGRMTDADKNVLADLKNLLQTLGGNSSAILEMLHSHTEIARAAQEEIKAVKARMDQLAREIANRPLLSSIPLATP